MRFALFFFSSWIYYFFVVSQPDDLLSQKIQSLCPTITGNVCCSEAQFDTLRSQVQQVLPSCLVFESNDIYVCLYVYVLIYECFPGNSISGWLSSMFEKLFEFVL
jgi:hypothetical protein